MENLGIINIEMKPVHIQLAESGTVKNYFPEE